MQTKGDEASHTTLTCRYGKPYKAVKHSSGGAEDEIEKVGNGG